MAFIGSSENGLSIRQEVVTLVNNDTVYSSVIDFLHLRRRFSYNTFTVLIEASAVSGTNVDVHLYGSETRAGTTKRQIDADIVTAVTDSTEARAELDIGATPWPYYFIGLVTDADETANTVTVTILSPGTEI